MENGQVFTTYVYSFEALMELVINKGLKFTNIKRTSSEIFFNQIFSFIDIISLVVIIALIHKGNSQQNVAKKFGNSFNKTKNFEVIKNVTTKFKDVAGLNESKREV